MQSVMSNRDEGAWRGYAIFVADAEVAAAAADAAAAEAEAEAVEVGVASASEAMACACAWECAWEWGTSSWLRRSSPLGLSAALERRVLDGEEG